MTDQFTSGKKPIITTGKGEDKKIIIATTQISTRGKIVQQSPMEEADVVFVIDTTGSMDDKIDALLATCVKFVDEARKLELDPNFALISFGDISVPYSKDRIEVVVPLTAEIDRIKHGLTHIPRNHGYGNEGESGMEALQEVFKLTFRPDAVKVVILITDEPAHQNILSASEMNQRLKKQEFLTFVVAPPFKYYQDLAKDNGGFWKEVGANTDFSEILDIFRKMAEKVSQVAKDVHLLGGGSVSRYLLLKPPGKE